MEAPHVAATPGPSRASSSSAIALFVIASIGISALIVVGHLVVWNLEQTAIADESFRFLANAGKIWFVAQAAIVAVLTGIAVAVSKSVFRLVYKSWLIASLVTLPALVLRFLGPNNDQVGALLQILICLVAAGIVFILGVGRRRMPAGGRAVLALAIVPLGIWPFLLWGALGSGTDTIVNVLVGLAFGLLAATLVVTTDSNYFLNGLGTGVLLAILGSAIGYDGGQLLLLAVLPSFGFVITYFATSLAAAPLVFIDPTELTIVLGDLLPWAIKASLLMLGLGLLIGLAAWILMRD